MDGRILCGFLLSVACTTTPKKNELCDVCPETDLIDLYNGQLDDRDQPALDRAYVVCKEQYGPENPCVAQFTRFEPGSYHVLCGPTIKQACEEE